MTLRETVQFMIYLLGAIVLTTIIFISTLSALLRLNLESSYQMLFSIIMAAFVSALPSIIFVWTENVLKKAYFWLTVLHIFIIVSFVLISLNYFSIFNPIKDIYKVLLFVLIYACVHIISVLKQKSSQCILQHAEVIFYFDKS